MKKESEEAVLKIQIVVLLFRPHGLHLPVLDFRFPKLTIILLNDLLRPPLWHPLHRCWYW